MRGNEAALDHWGFKVSGLGSGSVPMLVRCTRPLLPPLVDNLALAFSLSHCTLPWAADMGSPSRCSATMLPGRITP